MAVQDMFVGSKLGTYRIERLLGWGGMGQVYYGWDERLDRPVAIKVIDARYRNNPAHAERFIREARAIASWQHPNILQIYYAGEENGVYYYAMEYVPGLDLGQLLVQYVDSGELMPFEDVLVVIRAVSDALDYAHKNGVVHRDVKPANIIVAQDGRVVLTDFGLALNLSQGTIGEVMGSPHYIAPEQARSSANAIPQSDLYALGIVLFEMLTGQVPFDDPSPTAIAIQHLTQEPPSVRHFNPRLNRAVEAVVQKAISKNPADRYQSGQELLDALEIALQETDPIVFPENIEGENEVTGQAPALSRVSVADRVASTIARQSSPVHPDALRELPSAGKQTTKLIYNPFTWWAIGCSALALLVVVAGAALAGVAFRSPGSTPVESPSQSSLSALIETTIPTGTDLPTKTPALIQTEPVRTEPAAIEPTAPVKASATEQVPAPAPSSGQRFVMFYDDTGFYLKNLSGQDLSVSPFAFERIGKNDVPYGRVSGRYFAEIYPKFRADYCMVIEIYDFKKHLSPDECKGLYLVLRTPTLKQEESIFWTQTKASKEFRVLWNEEEVARCKTNQSFCEFYLP